MIVPRQWRLAPALAVAICALATSGVADSQETLSPEFGRSMTQGRTASRASKYDDAQQAFERAVELATAANRAPETAAALLALAETQFVNSRYALSRESATRAMEIGTQLQDAVVRGRAAYYLGLVADRLGQRDEALKQYNEAVTRLRAADEPKLLSLSLLELASAENDHPVTRPERYREAQALAERSGDDGGLGRVLHLWGDRLYFVGENEAALEKYQQAVTAFTKADRLNDVGTVYNSIGRLYRRHEQIETALDYQKRALSLHEKHGIPFSHMQSLNAVGVTLQALGRYRDAMPYLERALSLARESKNVRAEDFVAGNLSGSLLREGDFKKAAALLEGVIERKLDSYPSIRYYNLAEAYTGLGQLERAEAAANQSLETCGDRRDLTCVDAHVIRSKVHLARHDSAAALVDLERALGLIEDARQRLIPADFFKQQFGRSAMTLFGQTIELQLADGRAREALETAEQARSRAFLDLLASQSMPLQAAAAATMDDHTSQRRSDLIAPSPRAQDLAAIAARLQSTLLLYWVASDRVFIWTVQPDGRINATSVPVRESRLADLVSATAPFSAATGSAANAAMPGPWRALYELLIQPVRDQLPTAPGSLVTVVPHGPLTMLSFAALQDKRARYLLEDYTLHYVPAAGILQYTATRLHEPSAAASTLVVADPKLPRRSILDRPLLALPGARLEARAIAQLAPPRTVVTLEGAAANERAVRDSIQDRRVIHFATHAIVSDAEPFSSFLALAQSDATPAHDGTLTAQEIYGLHLQADLVVLSACRSGGGRVTGDGLSTFARAFLYAGAPSMITSVWDVADESTSHLIPQFYRAWHGGASKARALRAAQLAVLADLRKGTLKVDTAAGLVALPEHPALWAGFTLIGEPQ